jgi:hypothetical protein
MRLDLRGYLALIALEALLKTPELRPVCVQSDSEDPYVEFLFRHRFAVLL